MKAQKTMYWGVMLLIAVATTGCSTPSTKATSTETGIPPSTTQQPLAVVVSPTTTPTVTPTRTSIPTPMATPLPSWVSDFAEPILAAIKDHQPSFQDDFSSSSGKGWYIGFIGHPKYGLTIEKEILIVKRNVNEGCDPISNLALTHPNFVLQVDLPGNYGDVEFHGFMGGGPRHFFAVKGQSATLRWSFGSSDYSRMQQSGELEKTISIGNGPQAIIIKKGSKAAFYLNETPLAYIEDPILDAPIYGTMFNCGRYDNVKFWNLDKIPELP